MNITIEAIFISPDHNYVGHHGGPSGNTPAESRERITLIAGHGIEGDRYSRREFGHPKQITFFDMDTIARLRAEFDLDLPPQAVRRNVFVRGLDLPTLVGKPFRINGILFEGVDPCKPCYWMNEAVAPGAEKFLLGRGGLRARILQDGFLQTGPADFVLEDVGE